MNYGGLREIEDTISIEKLKSKQVGYITGDLALNLIMSLSYSQGCWGRMLRDLYENDEIENFKEWVEKQKFTSELDLIMKLEGN